MIVPYLFAIKSPLCTKNLTSFKRGDLDAKFKNDEIMKEIENYYRDLYTSNSDVEDDWFENFVHNLEIPKLQDLEKKKRPRRKNYSGGS